MKKLLTTGLTTLAFMTPLACGKIYNSSTYDATSFGAPADGSAKFLAAKQVIKTSCANCHTHTSHQAWAGMSEQDFINQGLVKVGNLNGSSLYTKIQGNTTTTIGNMPVGGVPLTTAEITTIGDWILGI